MLLSLNACRSFFSVLLLVLFLLPINMQAQEVRSDSTLFTYEQHIRSVLVRACFECHAGMEEQGMLLLDSYAALMYGGEHGRVIVPGYPDSSTLYQKLLPDPPFGRQMPRKRALRLSDEELRMIRLWIEQGARRTNAHADSSQ